MQWRNYPNPIGALSKVQLARPALYSHTDSAHLTYLSLTWKENK